MAIYYDKFATEYVTETDWYAAPERYYEMVCGAEPNLCIEKWLMDNGDIVEVRYAPVTMATNDAVTRIHTLRSKKEVEHNSKLSYMLSYTIPKGDYLAIEKWVYSK